MNPCRAALALDPLDRDNNFHTAYWAWERAKAGDEGATLEAICTYERLSQVAPRHPEVRDRLQPLRERVVVTPE